MDGLIGIENMNGNIRETRVIFLSRFKKIIFQA